MAGASGGAEQGFSAGDGANEDDVGDGDGRLGEVAAGQLGLVGLGQGKQAVEEAARPMTASRAGGWRKLARKAEGKKGGDGTCAHGGQIA